MSGGPVALDAMGGDHAPAAAVAGALRAAQEGIAVVLVGDRAALEVQLASAGGQLPIVDAPDAVDMDEDPILAVRSKPQSSVRVACQLVADAKAGAALSAGSTGATLAAALLTVGRLPGVRRPVVAAVLPAAGDRQVVLVDAGGSVDVQPEALAGYATMGAAYARVLGAGQPRIGLLNVGEEAGKGNALAKAAFELLTGDAAFVGNVEPAAVLRGDVDVVVTDGFTGNVFLKTIEAAMVPARDHGDAAAVLLGIRGEVLVAHGAADADDVHRALRRADQVARAGLARSIERHLGGEETAGGDQALS